MTLLVDTSVWALAFRRNEASTSPEVAKLRDVLESGETVLTTGLILQELLQGFSGPKAREQLIEQFSALPALNPTRSDHIAAAALRNHCRQAGVQVGTVDALLAQLCIQHGITLLSVDHDFLRIAEHSALRIWKMH
jgi:predicted nucleic acid-binding protein